MKTSVYLLIILTGLLIGCKKEDTKPAIQSRTFEINATGSTTWAYFSFDEDDTVTVTDPLNSDAWDLAFQRYRIKTNGGKSGSGQGCAANSYLKGQNGFDALKVIPETTNFVQDDSITIAVQQGYMTYVVNPELYQWFTMEMATQGTQIVPSDTIYIIKTHDGKYAKAWFKSYYSATDVSGHITFQYAYQPDGSRVFE